MVNFEDPRVQLVYSILCNYDDPPEGEHWEGWVARKIVDVLFTLDPAAIRSAFAKVYPTLDADLTMFEHDAISALDAITARHKWAVWKSAWNAASMHAEIS